MDDYDKVLKLLDRPLGYSDRAKRDMERAHFTEEMLVDLLRNPKKVRPDKDGFVVRAKKTAKIKLRITEEDTVFVESFSYNQAPFVF